MVMRPPVLSKYLFALIAVGTMCFPLRSGFAQYTQTNLVTDGQSITPAITTDPNLRNPWGIASGPTSPVWVTNENTGVATLYTQTGTVPLVVTVPPGAPTGIVFNTAGLAFTAGNGSG